MAREGLEREMRVSERRVSNFKGGGPGLDGRLDYEVFYQGMVIGSGDGIWGLGDVD